LYASRRTSIIKVFSSRRMRWAGHVTCIGEIRNAYKILVGKSEEKTPLGRPRHRWKGNIGMDLRETDWKGVDWIRPAQDRGKEPPGSITGGEFLN